MMKNIDQLYNKIIESVSKHVKNVLNEGAGAGYTVKILGLNATDFRIGDYDVKNGQDIVYFKCALEPGEVEWSAEGAYESVTSDGVEYNGIIDEFPVEDRTVQGGEITGHIYLDDVEDYLRLDGKGTKKDIIEYLEDHLKDFGVSYMYGGGWIHVNLPNPIVFEPNERRHEYPIEAEHDYDTEPTFIDKIVIDAERVAGAINWFFENVDDFDVIYGEHEDVSESMIGKTAGKKHINESFTMEDDLRQILRDFRTNIDMSRFYKVALVDEETYEPSLQRIIDTYDPYVEEVIGFITCPDSSYAEQNIKRIAQDNEWENGTEANMAVNFLYDLYDWCLQHGLRNSVNESEENLSQSEKMDLWHKGKRDQNLKACGADKLRKNLAICKEKGYDAEASAIEAEIKSRGLKESIINEGEVNDGYEATPEFMELVNKVMSGDYVINGEKDAEIIFDEFVPGSGYSKRLGGEEMRAVMRIAYRYYNDGDKAGEGYGRETVNPAVRFLNAFVQRLDGTSFKQIVKRFKNFVDYGVYDITDDEYELLIKKLLETSVEYIIKSGDWKRPNNQDMWDYRDEKVDVDRDDYDEEDW